MSVVKVTMNLNPSAQVIGNHFLPEMFFDFNFNFVLKIPSSNLPGQGFTLHLICSFSRTDNNPNWFIHVPTPTVLVQLRTFVRIPLPHGRLQLV